jgi:PAS domain S-box-containing protein
MGTLPMSGEPPESINLENEGDRFRLLVDAVNDYAIYMLDLNGCVASWNAGAERLKGYSAAEIIGQPYWRFFTAEDQQRGLPARILASASGRPPSKRCWKASGGSGSL